MAAGVLLVIFGLAVPANAADYGTGDRCTTFNGGTSACAHVSWDRQSDGDGVVLQGVGGGSNGYDLNSPCFHNAQFHFINPVDTSGAFRAYNYGDEDCHWAHGSIAYIGRDHGGMIVQVWEQANIHLGYDKCVEFQWHIYGDGTFTYDGAAVDPGGVCG